MTYDKFVDNASIETEKVGNDVVINKYGFTNSVLQNAKIEVKNQESYFDKNQKKN